MADISALERDQAVKKWAQAVSEWTYYNYVRHFASFYDWLQIHKEDLEGLSPSELLDYQEGLNGRKAYEIADLAMSWANELGGAHNTIRQRMVAIKSFFQNNRVPLPQIKVAEKTKPTKPLTEGKLEPEDLKKIVLAARATNPLYAAVIMTAFQGGMDASSIVRFSNHGYPEFKEQADRGEKVIILNMAGRKKSRFKRNFFTMINGDAVEAIQHYIKEVRGHVKEGESLFLSEKRNPLTAKAIGAYWRRKIYNTGLGRRDAPSCQICGAKTTRRRLTAKRIISYQCAECGWTVPASEWRKDTQNTGKGHRTGVGFHELRDTFRTVWSKSPAQNDVAEWMMGHKTEKFDYDKADRDLDYMKSEYLKAALYLNILSSNKAFGLISESEIQEAVDEKTKALQQTVRELENKLENAKEDASERLKVGFRVFNKKLEEELKREREFTKSLIESMMHEKERDVSALMSAFSRTIESVIGDNPRAAVAILKRFQDEISKSDIRVPPVEDVQIPDSKEKKKPKEMA